MQALREGDPRLKIATCNVTTRKGGKYDKPIELFRPRLQQVDLFTVHTYAQTEAWPTWRRTFPESPATPYLEDVRKVVAWRDAHAPGKPVWVTEFGGDRATSLADRKGDFAKWEGNVSDTVQAAYLLRSIPLFLAEGVERAHIYFYDDKDEPKLHAASGILRHGQPKLSWYALRQMQNLLGDAKLERLDHQDGLYIATWRKADGKVWLMLWTAEKDRATSTRALSLPHASARGCVWYSMSMPLCVSSLRRAGRALEPSSRPATDLRPSAARIVGVKLGSGFPPPKTRAGGRGNES